MTAQTIQLYFRENRNPSDGPLVYEFGLIARTRSVRGVEGLLNLHDCASVEELRHEGERVKKEVDQAVSNAARQFAEARRQASKRAVP